MTHIFQPFGEKGGNRGDRGKLGKTVMSASRVVYPHSFFFVVINTNLKHVVFQGGRRLVINK
jgi:hypothetical protein